MTKSNKTISPKTAKRLRKENKELQSSVNELYNAYQMGRFRDTPQMLIERLKEYSSATVLQLRKQLLGTSYTDSEDARVYQRNESRQQWLYSPLAQWCVNVWTSYGLGEKVEVTLNDDGAQPLWDTVWDNSTLFDDDQIQTLSENVLVDGEVYIAAFFSVSDGAVTSFELLDTDEIVEICTDPDNKNKALYYKREYSGTDMQTRTIYYPDYHAYFTNDGKDLEKYTLPADAVTSISEKMSDKNGTSAVVLHIAHNRKDSQSLHGWPILGIAAPYLSAHKSFVEDRLTVSHNKASLVRDYTVEGGSRGVAAVKARLGTGITAGSGYTETNPMPVAGASGIHNQGITMTDLPMTTGAGDANTDNLMFAWMAGIGSGVFPTTMGLDATRWATALQMDKTQATQWARYQSFWTCQFRKMVEIVLLADEKWGGGNWEDKGCTVSIDTLSLVDFPGVVTPISQMLGTISTMTANGTIPQQAAREMVQAYILPTLTALGAENVDEILSDEIMGIMTPEEREAQKAEEEAAKAQPPAEPELPPEQAAQAAEYRNSLLEFAREIYTRRIAEKAKADG